MGKRVRVFLETLGCKLNQAEGEALARGLSHAGYELVAPNAEADVYVLNTCTVTRTADRKARQALRAFLRQNPRALVVATGCYAERTREELAQIQGVGLIIGNKDKPELVTRLGKELGVPQAGEVPLNLRTRSFVKIQDGCANFCAYCIVPYVRRREKSQPPDQIVSEIRARVSEGYKEVVLTGTEIGAYCYDGLGLIGLIKRILTGTDVMRLRLSSLQPPEIIPELVSLWDDKRLCCHFHLSLQSGSDGVLRRMKRRYSVADYRKAVSLIRDKITDVAITTDVIVGFPGETDGEFRESFDFCREVGFSRIHVFSYSRRPGTEAAEMPGQVDERVKKARSQKMLALSRESARGFIQKFIGRRMPVLFEQPESEGVWSGLTDNYIRVYVRSDEDLTNKLVEVRLEKLYRDGVWGE
ncbi:MAG: tRNA (N(6)-L-threonylcarbamoyladenosine(37)-C(2))-methylthiotransferase MtaB [Chloroflexota bacterium]